MAIQNGNPPPWDRAEQSRLARNITPQGNPNWTQLNQFPPQLTSSTFANVNTTSTVWQNVSFTSAGFTIAPMRQAWPPTSHKDAVEGAFKKLDTYNPFNSLALDREGLQIKNIRLRVI